MGKQACSRGRAPPPAPPPPRAAAQPVYPPLRPIDEEIVSQVLESGDSLRMLQYYISDTVNLIRGSLIHNVEIRNGAGLRRERSATGEIVIQKGTAGVLVNSFFNSEGRRILAVSFDDANDRDVLFFLWSPNDRRFNLDYDIESRLVGYGDQQYQVVFSDETPHLLISFTEERTHDPFERVIQGRFIR